ncbi:10069_t:CDS:2, partial [Racocetra fulgida]
MSYLNNPTKYHLEQIKRQNKNMTIPANDAALETLHNSFNGSKVRPNNLRIDTTLSYVSGHIKQKSKSFKVDLNQQLYGFASDEYYIQYLQICSMQYYSHIDPTTRLDDNPDEAQRWKFLNEKRRRRREGHNADNINEKIQELSTLIPDNFLYRSPTDRQGKGFILRRVVEYIKHLQQLVGEQTHNIVLENTVRDMRPEMSIENNSDLNKLSQCNCLDDSVTNGLNIQNNNTTQNKASQNNNIITS